MTCSVAVFAAGLLFQALSVYTLTLDECRAWAANYQRSGYGVRRETFKAENAAAAAPARRAEDN